MISAYSISDGLLRKLDCSADSQGLADATWVDLLEPTKEQEVAFEAALGIEIPTPDEVRSIDASSQIYRENGALVMTARVVSRNETAGLRLVTVSFILSGGKLITLRYGDPTPFRNFVDRAEREPARIVTGTAVMVGLLEAIVSRAAELLQTVGDEMEALSTDIFGDHGSASGPAAQRDLQPIMQKIGRNGDLAKRVRGSLHTLARIVPYMQVDIARDAPDEVAARLATLEHDIKSLLDHDGYLMSNVTFLLDATLGLINIQQNAIIKIFSVTAVIFLLPTLVASIYGMNFEYIPEVKWLFGYPYALGLMVVSAVLPYCYFKRKKSIHLELLHDGRMPAFGATR
jgi:magnesium transporter